MWSRRARAITVIFTHLADKIEMVGVGSNWRASLRQGLTTAFESA